MRRRCAVPAAAPRSCPACPSRGGRRVGCRCKPGPGAAGLVAVVGLARVGMSATAVLATGRLALAPGLAWVSAAALASASAFASTGDESNGSRPARRERPSWRPARTPSRAWQWRPSVPAVRTPVQRVRQQSGPPRPAGPRAAPAANARRPRRHDRGEALVGQDRILAGHESLAALRTLPAILEIAVLDLGGAVDTAVVVAIGGVGRHIGLARSQREPADGPLSAAGGLPPSSAASSRPPTKATSAGA